MECVICKNGVTEEGKATVTLEKKGTVIVIKEVPAHICQNCGHYYLEDEMSQKLLALAAETIKKGVEVEVMHLQAS